MNQCKKLPPGWDTKLEPKSGKSYFVNYFTRNVSLDDPRINPQLGTTNQDSWRNGERHVPLMGASAVHSTSHATGMTETVARIRSIFPTVPETHIKALLIKYHGRECVVVSALQVEKHPVRTPGPFTPPPPVRAPLPILCRPQPKPHSPKMKLRYLKSVFPVVEETVLLDTLVNADNNVTHATEKLLHLGFNKREIPAPRVCLNKSEREEEEQRRRSDEDNKVPPPPKSTDDKIKIKERICAKHPEVPEKVVLIALESASYNEETAEALLGHMLQEEQTNNNETSEEVREPKKVVREPGEIRTEALPLRADLEPIKPRLKNNKLHRNVRTPIPEEEEYSRTIGGFISPLLRKAVGPDKNCRRGPHQSLLLEDYVPWIGSEKGLAQGHDSSLVSGRVRPKGPNLSLRKGPCPTLAKGSIYANFISTSDSRGK